MRLRSHVRIEKPTDHPLVLGVVPSGFGFEELDTFLAQGQGDLDAFFAKSQFSWRRKKVRDNAKLAQRLIGIFDFRAHK
jgi:hypothetical protein